MRNSDRDQFLRWMINRKQIQEKYKHQNTILIILVWMATLPVWVRRKLYAIRYFNEVLQFPLIGDHIIFGRFNGHYGYWGYEQKGENKKPLEGCWRKVFQEVFLFKIVQHLLEFWLDWHSISQWCNFY